MKGVFELEDIVSYICVIFLHLIKITVIFDGLQCISVMSVSGVKQLLLHLRRHKNN